MAFNPFIGWSQEDLESALERAQTDLAQGKTTIQASDGSIMIKSAAQYTPAQRIEMLYQALFKLDPATYPREFTMRTTQTRVVFGSGDGQPATLQLPALPPPAPVLQNSISYAGPPTSNPPYIAAIVVDSNGRQWQYFQGAWH